MQIIPASAFPQRDKASLGLFLGHCRDLAKKAGSAHYASISLDLGYAAPLAVLDLIREPGEPHFYLERQAANEAVAAAEAAEMAHFSGLSRFQDVQRFTADVLSRVVATGDLDSPVAGPRFFFAMAFDEEEGPNASFRSATVLLPRWQVTRLDSSYGAVANVKVDPDCSLDDLVERTWAAHGKLVGLQYEGSGATPQGPLELEVTEDPAAYEDTVRRALEAIAGGSYQKIVLARAVEARGEGMNPGVCLHRLRERYAECHAFSFSDGTRKSLIGATPELLARVRGGRLESEALAGSAPRGETAASDARLASELLTSEKNLHEHHLVLDSICRRLEDLGVSPEYPERPDLMALSNVQHLRTPIQAPLPEEVSFLEVLAELHPTPAVGGSPREAAVPLLRELEGIDRGLYAGVLGWLDHAGQGEAVVPLRSGIVEEGRALLFAGAGIVEGSDPVAERRETDLKLQAMLETLAGG